MPQRFKCHRSIGILLGVFLMTLVACLHLAPGLAVVSEAEIGWHVLDWNGLERMYGIYVPDSVDDPAPLVFLLHGGGGSASKTWNQDHARSWKALADNHGFMLVLPEGRADLDDATAHHWNDCRTDLDPTVIATTEDDVGFIIQLIEQASAFAAIDTSRVYVTGASNGGMMTYRLATEAGDHFAAVAAIIANLPDPSECVEAMLPVPMLIMNGTDDPIMPYEGGCVASNQCQRGRVMSTLDTIAFWVDANQASNEPTVETLPNRAWFDGSTVTVYHFDGGHLGADVVYYHIKGGGHNVPGFETIPRAVQLISGHKNRDIDAPFEIWSFFETL